jgi:alkaline phosphatase
MYKLILLSCLVSVSSLSAQPVKYTTANAHSHNDYEQPVPFFEAYRHEFGSIEADIYLLDESGELYVAHTTADLNKKRRILDSLYLIPLVNVIRKNKGSVYADPSRSLQLLIDIKTEAVSTLNRLIAVLRKYPELINTPSLRVVISGNRPSAEDFDSYPSFIHFDGVLGTDYSQKALSRISLLSVSFRQFSKWNGMDTIPGNEKSEFVNFIRRAHAAGKPVRFWAAPDTIEAWKELIKLQVDYINTDHIAKLSKFLTGGRNGEW